MPGLPTPRVTVNKQGKTFHSKDGKILHRDVPSALNTPRHCLVHLDTGSYNKSSSNKNNINNNNNIIIIIIITTTTLLGLKGECNVLNQSGTKGHCSDWSTGWMIQGSNPITGILLQARSHTCRTSVKLRCLLSFHQ